MELRWYGSVFRKWYWLLLLFALVPAAGIYGVIEHKPRLYEGSTTLLINVSAGSGVVGYDDVVRSQKLTRTYTEMFKKRSILEAALANAGSQMRADDLAKAIVAQPVGDTLLLVVKVRNSSPQLAADLANSLAMAFVEDNRRSRIDQLSGARRQLQEQGRSLGNQIRETYTELELASETSRRDIHPDQARISMLRAELAQSQYGYYRLLKAEEDIARTESRILKSISVVESAIAPSRPVVSSALQMTALACLLGLAFGAFLVVTAEILRRPSIGVRGEDTGSPHFA